jgi:hypothetical protein
MPTSRGEPDAAAVAERPGLALGDELPLRVGFVGSQARDLLRGPVHGRAVSGASELAEARLDALVLDPEPALDAAELGELTQAARDLHLPVIGFDPGGDATPPWEDIVDLAIGSPGRGPECLAVAAPVDVRRFNPTAFQPTDAAGFACIASPRAEGERLRAAIRFASTEAVDEPVTLIAPARANLPPLPSNVGRAFAGQGAGAVREALPCLGVLDHPGFHASEWERAGLMAKLCASGMPVVCAEMSDELRALLGSELAELLEPLSARDLADLDHRERISVAVRRAAMRGHSDNARWRQIAEAAGITLPGRPMVSVIFSTRREDWLQQGLAQVNRQTYEPRELVVCLHGDEFGEGIEERVRSLATGDVRIVRVDGDLTLGDALNAGVEVAQGELITKMDDDDYYNTDHLWDLALALEYSGADLAGKGAEFVYLDKVDLTIRRFMGDGESDHPRLAGGGMMARRAPLDAVGGWPSRTRGEDTWIVKNFKSAGRATYRTHGFGYILNRHFRDHTWNTYVDYFLLQSQREWRGLRFDKSAID